MENAQNSKTIKIITFVVLFSVMVFFITIPAAIVGSTYQEATDNAAENLDKLDNSNDFTPGEQSGDSFGQKAISAFDGSK